MCVLVWFCWFQAGTGVVSRGFVFLGVTKWPSVYTANFGAIRSQNCSTKIFAWNSVVQNGPFICFFLFFISFIQWRIQKKISGGGACHTKIFFGGGVAPNFRLFCTMKKNFGGGAYAPHAPPPWIRHCFILILY